LRRQRQRDAVQAGLAVGVVLVEHGDFFQAQAGQLFDDEAGLVVVRSAHVEGVFVERLAQRHGAGEGREERHLRGLVASGSAAMLVGVPM
jgi:hypothetical protein